MMILKLLPTLKMTYWNTVVTIFSISSFNINSLDMMATWLLLTLLKLLRCIFQSLTEVTKSLTQVNLQYNRRDMFSNLSISLFLLKGYEVFLAWANRLSIPVVFFKLNRQNFKN